MLAGDSEEIATNSAKTFKIPQIQHFYDPNQRAGKAVAASIGWKGKTAWDIYLFYRAGEEWIENPPEPTCWMHQLTENRTDREHYRTGADLVQGLARAMEKLL
ncbi:MAG: hypothetical protein KJO34_04165 [Deltaproteobacteria bacterium]|nr:hypothetical protein [Deltaproteobacteria bacterium]